MRVLLSSTSGAGHFRPLLPFARALQRAGHDLACAAPAEAAPMVEREGLRHLPLDGVPGDHPDRLAVLGSVPTLPPDEARFLFGSVIFGRLNTTWRFPERRRPSRGSGRTWSCTRARSSPSGSRPRPPVSRRSPSLRR